MVNQLFCEIHINILVAMISDHKIDVSSLMTVFTNTLKMNRLVGPVVCQNIPAPKKFTFPPYMCNTKSSSGLCYA